MIFKVFNVFGMSGEIRGRFARIRPPGQGEREPAGFRGRGYIDA